ncbi:hypothetical protein, partial [Microbacterium sp.]|uniref:hypothetical protein n=1 Tax=Microbacterium sp. TaxID=51671 RepID=UPI003F9BE75A
PLIMPAEPTPGSSVDRGFVTDWRLFDVTPLDEDAADERIAVLTQRWEDVTGDVAGDYDLAVDDWLIGLDRAEADEVNRLIEWRDAR